jgi:hypothetical protein
MTKHLILVVSIFLVFSACSVKTARDKNENSTYYKSGNLLHKQRILNSSKILYTYVNCGEYAWGSFHYGTFFLDSTENVNQTKSIKDLLPFYYTKLDLDNNKIEAIELLYSKEANIEGMYEKLFNGITYRVKRYNTEQGSGMLFAYIYQNLTETEDSVFFKKLTIDGFGVNLPNNTGFRKGNITVEEDSLGFVSKLRLTILNQYPLWEKMRTAKSDTIRLDDNVFKGEDQIHLPPLSLVYSFDIELTPDSLSKKQKISDYGVYKLVIADKNASR